MIYLHHMSFGADLARHTKILKDGYLRPGYKTGVSEMYGKPTSKWVYVSLPILRKQQRMVSHYMIDPMCLLTTRFVIHEFWRSEDNIDPKGMYDGRTLTPTKLKTILKKFIERCQRKYYTEKRKYVVSLQRKEITKAEYEQSLDRLQTMYTDNEILVENDIDLHTYLRGLYIFDSCKLTPKKQQLLSYIRKTYPDVKGDCM
jgi:hypothetical protein